MSLNWNMETCKDWETLRSDSEWPITHGVIFSCLAVDFGDINSKNVAEFYARIKAWEFVNKNLIVRFNEEKNTYEPYYLTFEDIYKRIGLKSNVTNKSLKAYLQRLQRIINEDEKPIPASRVNAVYYAALADAEDKLDAMFCEQLEREGVNI